MMVASPSNLKTAKQLVELVVNKIPVGPALYNEDTGNTYYLGEVIPTKIEPNNLLLTDLSGTMNPGYHRAAEAIDFVEGALTPFEKDLDYRLKGNKASPDYAYLKQMIANYGERP